MIVINRENLQQHTIQTNDGSKKYTVIDGPHKGKLVIYQFSKWTMVTVQPIIISDDL